MPNAIYAGSFDPFTNGHLHVLSQACKVFDKVYLAIAINSDKSRRVDKDIMKKAMEEIINNKGIENAEVVIFNGLTVDLAKQKEAEFLIRGLRNGTDYEYEENMAVVNNKIAGIETIYFRAGKTSHISSSSVMQLHRYGKDISSWVPKEIIDIL
jgi:pantetheine-phosphate adenylyltransferase